MRSPSPQVTTGDNLNRPGGGRKSVFLRFGVRPGVLALETYEQSKEAGESLTCRAVRSIFKSSDI
jgi:hypothetical protein